MYSAAAATSSFLAYHLFNKQKLALADDGNQQNDNDRKTFFQENVIDIEAIKKDKFKIPQLLMERENKKKEEYASREQVSATELGMDAGEIAQMKEMDFMYGGETT